MESVKDRVARGADWMQSMFPEWRKVIDPEEIDMDTCGGDVRSLVTGAQIKIGYDEVETAWEFAHGFWPDNPEEWGELTAEWREQATR